MQVKLDKEKPSIGTVRGFNVAAVRANCRFGVVMLRHNLLQKPSLTVVRC
jgi:hypothetical protein